MSVNQLVYVQARGSFAVTNPSSINYTALLPELSATRDRFPAPLLKLVFPLSVPRLVGLTGGWAVSLVLAREKVSCGRSHLGPEDGWRAWVGVDGWAGGGRWSLQGSVGDGSWGRAGGCG